MVPRILQVHIIPTNISAPLHREISWALVDNGSTINVVTAEFVKACSLDIGPLSDLVNSNFSVNHLGRLFSQPLGYIIKRAQVKGVQGYNEDQVALAISDPTDFGCRVPVTLDKPTINPIINVIKESKMDELSVSLNGSRMSHLLASHQAELSVESTEAANQTMDLTDLNEAVKTMRKEEIDAFSSKIIHAWMKTMFLGSNMCVMMQTLKEDDGSCLPHGLSVMNTFTKITTGSKQVVVMVKNQTSALITITKGVKVIQLVAANAVPQW